MSRATLAELRDRALAAADMATLSGSQYLPTAEANGLVNESVQTLYDFLVSKSEDYFLRTAELQRVGDSEYYRLPDDLYKLRSASVGGTHLARYSEGERASLRYRGTPSYSLAGQGLSVLPAGSYPLTIRYVPTCPRLERDTDEVSLAVAPGWDTFVVYDAAAKMRLKAKQDASALQARADREQARIRAMAGQRDTGPRQSIDRYGWSRLTHRNRMWGF